VGRTGPKTAGRRRGKLLAVVVTGVSALGLAACGGGPERQDEDEPEGEFPVAVVDAQFPNRQRLAETTDLKLGIENTGTEQIPNLAVTIFLDDGGGAVSTGAGGQGSFSTRIDQPGLANPNRRSRRHLHGQLRDRGGPPRKRRGGERRRDHARGQVRRHDLDQAA
jgi:hypothetical protein